MIEERTCAAEELTDAEWEEILELTHAAFAEHKYRGLRMLPCIVTLPKLQQFLKSSTLFQVKHNGSIIAFEAGTFVMSDDYSYCDVRISCVHPEHKRKGLGHKVHTMLESLAVSLNCNYLQTDTSCEASGAKAFHHSCGFEDWYFVSWPGTNYYSIVMRKELPPGKKMSRKLRYKSLITSYFSIHFRYDKYGKERYIYQYLQAIKRKLWGK